MDEQIAWWDKQKTVLGALEKQEKAQAPTVDDDAAKMKKDKKDKKV